MKSTLSRKVKPQHVLRKMKRPRVIPQRLQILFRLPVLKLAYLGLSQAQPAAEKFLIQCFSEQLQVPGMIPVRAKNIADMLAPESDTELVCLEEFVTKLGGWHAELIPLLAVAPAAQFGRVVGGQRIAATAAAAFTRAWTGWLHPAPPICRPLYSSRDQRT
jgi:hypothetical protein